MGRDLTADALAQARAEPIELVQVPSRVEVRVLLDRDEQRRARQVKLALVAADQSPQRAPRFGCSRRSLGSSRRLAQVPEAGLSPEPEEVVLPVGVAEPELPTGLDMVPPP